MGFNNPMPGTLFPAPPSLQSSFADDSLAPAGDAQGVQDRYVFLLPLRVCSRAPDSPRGVSDSCSSTAAVHVTDVPQFAPSLTSTTMVWTRYVFASAFFFFSPELRIVGAGPCAVSCAGGWWLAGVASLAAGHLPSLRIWRYDVCYSGHGGKRQVKSLCWFELLPGPRLAGFEIVTGTGNVCTTACTIFLAMSASRQVGVGGRTIVLE